MTFANDFIEDKSLDDDYPSAFGITFTPMVCCIGLSVLGVVGAGYIYLNMVAPAQKASKTLKTQLQQKQTQLNQVKQKDYPQKVAKLKSEITEQKALKSKVMAMFTSQNDLETLLIDINSFVIANQGELVSYTPDRQISTIDDNSLGVEARGKLKKKGLSLEIKGTFSQTQAILQDIERLEPLLVINSYESQVTEEPTAILVADQGQILGQEAAILSTKLKIDAILPSSQKELEQAKKAEENAKQAESESKTRRKNK